MRYYVYWWTMFIMVSWVGVFAFVWFVFALSDLIHGGVL